MSKLPISTGYIIAAVIVFLPLKVGMEINNIEFLDGHREVDIENRYHSHPKREVMKKTVS